MDQDISGQIIHHSLELGVNFFDTAGGYQGGTREPFLGAALKTSARREDVVVATIFSRPKEEIDKGVSGSAHMQSLLERSLSDLDMDYIDLYICRL